MKRGLSVVSVVLLGLLASACAPAAATAGTTAPATVVVTRIVTATPEAAATETAVPTVSSATETTESALGSVPTAALPTSGTPGSELGWERSKPLPVGEAVSSGELSVRVVQVTRPANVSVVGDRLSGGPEPGDEYAMVVIEATCEKGADQMCRLSVASDLKLVGSDGIVRTPAPWFGASGDMLAQVQFFGGSTVRREAVFDVAQGETGLVLVYQPMLDMTAPPAYLALQ